MKSLHLLAIIALMIGSVTDLWAQAPTTENTQDVPFNGTVSDILGKPIKGARVYINPKRIARSDKKGRFGLTNVNDNDTIKVRYKKLIYQIPVKGRKSLRITLGDQIKGEEDDELVAWGYGFVKKRESTEVSNGISGEELRRTGETSLLRALQGRIPGLNIHPTSSVGPDASVSMRGINSLNADQTPLFVVDGIIVDSLDYISPYDVEHVEVLKDASIYGSRGANGAILVFTYRGGERK